MLYRPGDAYDLSLKMNMMTRLNGEPPFAFRGGDDAVRTCMPAEVAAAFAAAFRVGLNSVGRA